MLLLSALILIADSHGFMDVLGWSKSPGYFISFFLAAFSLFALFRHESLLNVSISVGLLIIPMRIGVICGFVRQFADIFPLSPFLWLLLTISPLLLGCCYVYRMGLKASLKMVYYFCSSYIASVHFYNMFYTEQHMGFFGGGWTA
jgi:hypothetical protein